MLPCYNQYSFSGFSGCHFFYYYAVYIKDHFALPVYFSSLRSRLLFYIADMPRRFRYL